MTDKEFYIKIFGLDSLTTGMFCGILWIETQINQMYLLDVLAMCCNEQSILAWFVVDLILNRNAAQQNEISPMTQTTTLQQPRVI